MATSHFPLKFGFYLGLLYTVTKINDASAQATQPPSQVYEPPSIPLPRWPIELNRTQNKYHVLPEYVQQQIRQPSEIALPLPTDSIIRTEIQKNPFRAQQPKSFNAHGTKPVYKHEANWMPHQGHQYPKDRSQKEQRFNPHIQQGPSNNPAYNTYPYKTQYQNGYSEYVPKGPSIQKSPDSRPPNRMPDRFDHHTSVKKNKSQTNEYPRPPPGYYGTENQATKSTAGLPQAILEYLQKQQAKDGLPPSLVNYLRSQAEARMPQSIQEITTQAPPVEISTEFTHQAPQHKHVADLQPQPPQEASTESPSVRTTSQPTTPVIELSKKAVADELMAKLSSQLESQSAAVQQLQDSFTTLSPLEASTDPTNSEALSLQFRKSLLKKLIARRLLTLKTIGNLSKNTTTVAPVSESATTAPINLDQGPATKPNVTSIEILAPHDSQGQGNIHQQSLPANPTVETNEPKTTGALQDLTTTLSPRILPGEIFPPNSHYVGHLPPDAAANPHANNQFQSPESYRHSFNAPRPNTYQAHQHFDNRPRGAASPQNEAGNIKQLKTASASGIPEISYVHSGQQNILPRVSPQPNTAAQNTMSNLQPARKELGMVTESTPVLGAPNELQTIEIPAMNNPTAKPGMVRVVYIPGKGGAKGFFRVIHVSAPGNTNPSTAQSHSPIQKYFNQDRLDNQQYPTPEQLRHAIKQEQMVNSHKVPSQTQQGTREPKFNPAVKSPQKFPAVDSTPLTGSQTNVKDSLVGLLNTLEPTKASKGHMSHYNQEKQASNSWTNYAPPTNNGYIPNQPRFDPKYSKEQFTKNPDVTQQKVNHITEPHQHYQEYKNFLTGNKKQGAEMSQPAPNLDPYYKLVQEQINKNSIFTTAAPTEPTTPPQIQKQFGYNNGPYGAHVAPWERHHMSKANNQNQGVQIQQNSIFTTAAPSKPTKPQQFQKQFGYNNGPYGAHGAPWERDHMFTGNNHNHGGRIQQNSIFTTTAPSTPSTSQQIRTQSQFGYNNGPYPAHRAPWERHHMSTGKNHNQGARFVDEQIQQNSIFTTAAPTKPTTPQQIQNFDNNNVHYGAPWEAISNGNQQNHTGPFEYPSRAQGWVLKTTEQPSTPVPMQTFEVGLPARQTHEPIETNARVQAGLTGAARSVSASIATATSNPGLKDPVASAGQGANTDVSIQDQLVQQTMMELLNRQPHLLQGNNLQELIQKLSQNISVPLIDNLNLNKASTSSSTGASSMQSNGSSIASPDGGHQRYPDAHAAPIVKRPKTQPASSHPVSKQWNPVYSDRVQNPHSGHHRNMNHYPREMHMGVYDFQGYEVPTTTTAIPTTPKQIPVNVHHQHQYGGRYGPHGPQSQYPIRGPERNFPIPIYEHTVLEKPKPQQSKPVKTRPESSYWKQRQQNHSAQHPYHWQQPAYNNQKQNQSGGHHNNQWQQQQQQQHRHEQQQYRGSPQQNQMHQQQNSTSQQRGYVWQQQQQQQQNQTNPYQPYWHGRQNQTNHQQYPRNQYQPNANQHQQQQYYQNDQHKQIHPQSNQQAPVTFQQNKHTAYLSGEVHHSQSSVVAAKPLQVQIPGNINLGAPQSSMTVGGYPVAPIQHGQATSTPLVDTLALQRSPLVDPVSPSGGVPDLTAGLPKALVVSFPGGGVNPGSDVLGILDPKLLSAGNPGAKPSTLAPSTSTVAASSTMAIPTTTIAPAHTFSSELMCTMQSECEMGCCYTLQGEILWDWKSMVDPPHLPQVGYCHTKASTKLGDGCEASFCPCVSANQVCLSVPPENFTIPAGYDAAEQGAISFGKCMSTAQKKAAVSHMTQAKMLVDMCMSDPSCPLHSLQLQKKKKK